ncbi:MAG: hypothetical protein NVSMB23_29780 [Myxococcales bacterium]
MRQAARLLANDAGRDSEGVRAVYQDLLATLEAEQGQAGDLRGAAAHFVKVTASYGDGLFHCYDVPDLPSTNNDLERRFGALRYHERRTTGRRSIPRGAIVRGSGRVITVLAADQHAAGAATLRLTDRAAWQALRQQLAERQETRRAQRRFRKDPDTYLSALEQLLQ